MFLASYHKLTRGERKSYI